MSSDSLRWGIVGIVFAIALGAIFLRYEETRPCAKPVAYTIGTIDPRFDVSTSTLVATAQAAADIWNEAAGKTLLAYDPAAGASLPISLVYDEREAAAQLGQDIARAEAALDEERRRIEALEADYAAREASYNEDVARVNASGGAPPREAAQFAVRRRALNELAATINTRAASYNAKVAFVNDKVDEYNETAGHPFEAGRYERDAEGERISIFVVIDATQLERVLAHELGHAIGLEHNGDPASIMYEQNESGNLEPSEADLADLAKLCGVPR